MSRYKKENYIKGKINNYYKNKYKNKYIKKIEYKMFISSLMLR